MQLARALEDKKLDLRLRDKLYHEGKLTKADLDKYLDSIPDDSANMIQSGTNPSSPVPTSTGSSES